MAIEIYSNGYSSTWDQTIRVGSVVTVGSKAGYYILTAVDYQTPTEETEDENSIRLISGQRAPIFRVMLALNADGSKVNLLKQKELICHSSVCCKVSPQDVINVQLIEQAKLDTKIDNLKQLVGSPIPKV